MCTAVNSDGTHCLIDLVLVASVYADRYGGQDPAGHTVLLENGAYTTPTLSGTGS